MDVYSLGLSVSRAPAAVAGSDREHYLTIGAELSSESALDLVSGDCTVATVASAGGRPRPAGVQLVDAAKAYRLALVDGSLIIKVS